MWIFLSLKIYQIFPAHIPNLKDCPYNLTKYESKWNSKISIFQLFTELGEICKYSLGYHSKIPIFHHFHKVEKLWSPTTATLTNPSFQHFSEFVKRLKYSLRTKHKKPNFESKDQLKNVWIWVSLLKIKWIYMK